MCARPGTGRSGKPQRTTAEAEMAEIPQSYDPAKAEREWAERWERDGIYRWDPTRPRAETFAVDTPPLTVSGSLHIGHVFSFTQADVIVRYQRMTGKNTF